MNRLAGFLSVLALVLGVSLVSAADDEKKPEKKFQARNPEAIFKKLDADDDGKLTKDEFKKFGEQLGDRGKLKDRPELREKLQERLFSKLDADSDGKLTLDEFKKLREAFGELRKKGNDK